MLKEVIDKFYSDRERDRKRDHFYITDAGKCQRAIFFKFKKAKQKETEPRILRLFDHGDHIHSLILGSLLGSRDIHVIAAEVKTPPCNLISGRADAIISDNKDLYVLDVKSMNSFLFTKLKEPRQDHINQIQLYLHFLDPKKGILLYVCKDTLSLKEFHVSYDAKLAKSLLKDLSVLEKKIKNNIIPSRVSNSFSNSQCRYCNFKQICKIANKEEQKWEDFKKVISDYDK